MDERVITMDEVAHNGWVAVRDDVLDLRKFAHAHPGGAVLQHLFGRDATHQILNGHAKNPAVLRALQRFRIGRLDGSTADAFDRDVLRLRDSLEARGMFEYKPAWLFADIVRVSALLIAGIALAARHPLVAFTLLTIACVDVVWWIHDAGHDAVFSHEKWARRAIQVLGIAVLGMPQLGYHYGVHRVHHAFLNVMGADLALDTGPVVWHPSMARRSRPWLVALQPVLWFIVILPLAFPILLTSVLRICQSKREWGTLAAVAIRWLVCGVWLFHNRWWLAIGPVMAAGSILAFMAGLNHFHLEISASSPASFTRAVVERTQNVRAGWFWTWVSGGLNYHVEHHLFATMPSRNYRLVANEVRALCEAHGMTYRVCGRGEAVLNLYRKLQRPFDSQLGEHRATAEATS